MPDHGEHAGHEPGTHGLDRHGHGAQGEHGPVAHVAPMDWQAAYTRAYEAAQPAPGRTVVSVDLEARELDWEFTPGRSTRAWGFNGQVPGPVIEAQVGDVLQVRLTNRLAEPTAIHWHGLRVPAAMDGTEMVQRPIAPGEMFTYRFKLPDAGTFWYHPHVHETVQLERGLYGAIVVRGTDEPRMDAERVLLLDDVRLDDAGQIDPARRSDWRYGRKGSIRLLNGRSEPELTMAAGQVERWRIVNAASARYVRLTVGERPFGILGTDGGLITRPFTTTRIVLAPGDRVDIAVGPFAEGEALALESLGNPHGPQGPDLSDREIFATVRVGPAAPSQTVIPELLREIEPIVTGVVEPTREIRLGSRPSLEHDVDFTINDELHHRADPCRVGQLQVWDIVNASSVDHPFHLHGFFFQVLEVDGEPPDFLSWEDTVNVPANGRVRIAWIPDDRPGSWMFHCHILEHHAAGMMAHFDVVR